MLCYNISPRKKVHFSPRPVGPRHGLPRPRHPPLARQIGGRPRPRDARLRGQKSDPEARFARAPVLKNYVPPVTTSSTTTTTTAVTTVSTTTTTTEYTTTTTTQESYFGGENTDPELQWYPMKSEKVIQLQNYKQDPLSWTNEILPSPEPLKSYQNIVDSNNVPIENIIDLTSTLKSGICLLIIISFIVLVIGSLWFFKH